MEYSKGAQMTDILKEASFWVISSFTYLVLFLVYRCQNLMTETSACDKQM
jgi:hypothetical protein